MTGAAQHIAGAALPVAIGLLVLALAARAALWAPADSPRLRALAREYLAPLRTWSAIAAAACAVALGAAGDASALSIAAPLAIAAAAGALRAPGTEAEAEAARDRATRGAVRPAAGERPAAAAAARPAASSAPAGARSLWAEPEDGARTGLWSR